MWFHSAVSHPVKMLLYRQVGGSYLLDGEAIQAREFKRMSGYVMQASTIGYSTIDGVFVIMPRAQSYFVIMPHAQSYFVIMPRTQSYFRTSSFS